MRRSTIAESARNSAPHRRISGRRFFSAGSSAEVSAFAGAFVAKDSATAPAGSTLT